MKYRVTDDEGNETLFLADIYEPLPSTGESAEVNAINKSFVSVNSSIPTYVPPGPPIVTPLDPIVPEVPDLIGGSDLAGGFSPEVVASFDDQEGLFTDESVLEQLREQSGFDFGTVTALAYRSQVVAGTNYIVKYAAVDEEGNEMFFLAEIFESLDGDATVNGVITEGVTVDSAIPSSLSSSSTELIIDPLPPTDLIDGGE